MCRRTEEQVGVRFPVVVEEEETCLVDTYRWNIKEYPYNVSEKYEQ